MPAAAALTMTSRSR